MRVRIHRGARIVGGSCVEIEVGTVRRIVGTGRLLDAGFDDEAGLACDTSGGAARSGPSAVTGRGDVVCLVGVAVSCQTPMGVPG
jgi:hypothetical protein